MISIGVAGRKVALECIPQVILFVISSLTIFCSEDTIDFPKIMGFKRECESWQNREMPKRPGKKSP
jgi:hypothetical protein